MNILIILNFRLDINLHLILIFIMFHHRLIQALLPIIFLTRIYVIGHSPPVKQPPNPQLTPPVQSLDKLVISLNKFYVGSLLMQTYYFFINNFKLIQQMNINILNESQFLVYSQSLLDNHKKNLLFIYK